MHLLRHSPHVLGIYYRGCVWRLKTCGTCHRVFWKNTSKRHLENARHKLAYCSKRCQTEGYRLSNASRQRRYQKRLAAGLVNHDSPRAHHGRIGGRNGKGVSRAPVRRSFATNGARGRRS